MYRPTRCLRYTIPHSYRALHPSLGLREGSQLPSEGRVDSQELRGLRHQLEIRPYDESERRNTLPEAWSLRGGDGMLRGRSKYVYVVPAFSM